MQRVGFRKVKQAQVIREAIMRRENRQGSTCKKHIALIMVTPYHKTGFTELFHELNLSLYRPKKDQCDTSVGYEAGNVEKETYQEKSEKKDRSSSSKDCRQRSCTK